MGVRALSIMGDGGSSGGLTGGAGVLMLHTLVRSGEIFREGGEERLILFVTAHGEEEHVGFEAGLVGIAEDVGDGARLVGPVGVPFVGRESGAWIVFGIGIV